MIDTSQDWAARLRPAIEPRDPKATKLEDMRTCSVATAPTHEHCIAVIQEGMILCARPLGVRPRSAGMRALPRMRLDSDICCPLRALELAQTADL